MRYSILIIFFSFFYYCSSPNNEEEYIYWPPVGGFQKLITSYDSTRNDTTYKIPIINSYTEGDCVFVFIGENHRSDGMPCLKEGEDLFFTLKSYGGDKEVLSLNSKVPYWMRWGDGITPFMKYIEIKVSEEITKENGIIEFKNGGDTLFFDYCSCWENLVLQDTLTYTP